MNSPSPSPSPSSSDVPGDRVPRILLADADAFFVAVARLDDPAGAGTARLLIVGGAPGSRGVVCSASYEARQFGVRSAMPIAQALRLCPEATCVPVPRGACRRTSREIAAVLGRFAPAVQSASVDEWYLDLSGTEALYGDASLGDVAHRIRDAVRASTGLSISLGGGRNKLVAKLAVEFAKPKPGTAGNGVCIVAPGAEATFMHQLSLADIPGIGPRLRERLEARGMCRVPDVLEIGLPALERMLGERAGRWLFDRVRGIGSAVVVAHAPAKSLSHEDTFDHDVNDDAVLAQELLRLVTRVSSDLRAKGVAARTITVKLKDADFRVRGARRTLDVPVVADRVILSVARELLGRLRGARHTPARLLGVGLSGLGVGEAEGQLSLFGDATPDRETETPRDRRLAVAVDALRARFGADAILPGSLAGDRTRHGPKVPNASPVPAAPRRGPG